jgi:hypothetical protein
MTVRGTDIAVGRTGESAGTGRGGVYIHFMNTNATIRSTVHITDGTTNGPTLATGDTYGYSIANIGDLNNDGIDDIAVGSYGNDMGERQLPIAAQSLFTI